MAIPGYRILRKIRQGGMSTVYLAIQKSIDREVALKVMSPSLSSDPSFGSRFYREAKIVGQLSHPNIVSIYDVGSYKHYNYIAMDYLPGAPLEDRLDEGISDQQASIVIREIAATLDYAHQRGYIHRDIKPDNILFHADGSAVLCDFGIAKALKGNIKMTNNGSVLGTPHYMSPEQAQGKDIDGRSDIYSLGVVFFEILSGQVPFSGDNPISVAVKHMTSPIPQLPSEHRALQAIIDKMMAKKASTRYQTGKEVIEALAELETDNSHEGRFLTQTNSTTVQVLGIIGALSSTLISACSLSFKRLMFTNITFSSHSVQLNHQQLADIDTFILNDHDEEPDQAALDDMHLIQDTRQQAALRYRFRWLYWPLGFIAVLMAGFIYLDENYRQQLQEIIHDTHSANVISQTSPNTIDADTILDVIHQPAIIAPENSKAVAEVVAEPKAQEVATFSLTIHTQPKNADVRIINIKPKYSAGMKLPVGAYHIAVSAEDYFPRRQWLRISDSPLIHTIELEPTQRILTPGSELAHKLPSGGDAPTMIVLPQESVSINHAEKNIANTSALAISQHEVSFEQYDVFAKQTDRNLPDDYGWGRGKRPVIGITYQDALDYAQWISTQTLQNYRLPRQQEWEYASRGGQGTIYWWGAGTAASMANCRKGCNSNFSKFFSTSTAPTGYYDANAYGLYDTAGNVAEWLDGCMQWADTEQTRCKTASVAGGSHEDKAKDIKPNSIKQVAADKASKTIGLRLLLEL